MTIKETITYIQAVCTCAQNGIPMNVDINVLELIIRVLQGYKDPDKWNMCSNKMPKEWDYVLFTDIDGDIYYGHYNHHLRKWSAENSGDLVKNVIAWTLIPQDKE